MSFCYLCPIHRGNNFLFLTLLLYNIALRLYSLGIQLAAFFYPKAKQFSGGRRNAFIRLKNALTGEEKGPVVWMHCASLGEFEQGRPVLEAFRSRFPEYAILLTFFSPSGYEVRKSYEGADWVFYLPIDSKRNATRFLSIVQPSIALFVKYEFWYHYLHELFQRKIPAILFSAHFQHNQPFFKPWGGFFRKMLSFYQQIFVQDKNSMELLKTIGIHEPVTVAGDTRLDRAAKVLAVKKEFPKLESFKQMSRLLIAGSSWPEDEHFLKKTLEIIPDGKYKLLVVPHEVQEQNIQRVLHLFGSEACLYDTPENTLSDKKVAVVHTVGQLSYLYRYADVVWIGGGFGKGIHNIIEPAVFEKPVCFGPHFERFKEAQEMLASGAASSFTDASAFAALLLEKEKLSLKGKLAGAYVAQHTGATKKIIAYLAEKCIDRTS